MTTNVKTTLGLVVAGVIALAALLYFADSRPAAPAGTDAPAAAGTLVRPDSHRLATAPDGAPEFVEFLDFECGSCYAAFPAVEQIRAEYAGRVTFVVRYFPIPSHANGENAAIAVEAAAQQGRFEDMYRTMFETQPQWGEQQQSQAPRFRQFAAGLGLDLAAYDRAVADPATLERVRADQEDGYAAGVRGTPTFFVDGTRLEPRSVADLRVALDSALADR
ncbi:MAG: DsbA family protein [Pseudonocardia sp.]